MDSDQQVVNNDLSLSGASRLRMHGRSTRELLEAYPIVMYAACYRTTEGWIQVWNDTKLVVRPSSRFDASIPMRSIRLV